MAAMAKPRRRSEDPDPDQLVAREIVAERILLREPRDGRVRAVLETGPFSRDPEPSRTPGVRLTLFGPDGKPALVVEVGADGEPALFVGNPDSGPAVAVTPTALDIWAGGNIAAALRTADEAGHLELADARGHRVVDLPVEKRPVRRRR